LLIGCFMTFQSAGVRWESACRDEGEECCDEPERHSIEAKGLVEDFTIGPIAENRITGMAVLLTTQPVAKSQAGPEPAGRVSRMFSQSAPPRNMAMTPRISRMRTSSRGQSGGLTKTSSPARALPTAKPGTLNLAQFGKPEEYTKVCGEDCVVLQAHLQMLKETVQNLTNFLNLIARSACYYGSGNIL